MRPCSAFSFWKLVSGMGLSLFSETVNSGTTIPLADQRMEIPGAMHEAKNLQLYCAMAYSTDRGSLTLLEAFRISRPTKFPFAS